MEHIPGYKNKAADCLSRLSFVTRKRNDNQLKDEISINMTQTEDEDNAQCCPMCVIDITNTKALQQQDRFCPRIAKMMVLSSYHINKQNDKEYKATIIPNKSSFKQYSRKCMTILAIYELAKHIL